MKANEILAKLVTPESAGYDNSDELEMPQCSYCGSYQDYIPEKRYYDVVGKLVVEPCRYVYHHSDDCPIVLGRKLLGL